jgi:hypothetical protein
LFRGDSVEHSADLAVIGVVARYRNAPTAELRPVYGSTRHVDDRSRFIEGLSDALANPATPAGYQRYLSRKISHSSYSSASRRTTRFTGAARSIYDEPGYLRCAASGAIASWAAAQGTCLYNPPDAGEGGHAPIRCRSATILPK